MTYTYDPAELPPYSPLYRDFVCGRPLPSVIADRSAARLQQRADVAAAKTVDPHLIDELWRYNRELGAAEATLANIERLRAPGTLVVITGQQPYPFGGPLFGLYKAVGAVSLAERFASELDGPVVPAFWVHSDDHDVDEIRSLTVIARGATATLTMDVQAGVRIGDLPADAARAAWEQLSELEPNAARLVRWEAGDDLGRWFGRVLLRLLGHKGLIVFDPRLESARRIGARVLHAAASDSHLAERVALGARRMELAGYKAGLSMEGGHSGIFVITPHRREALLWSGSELVSRSGDVRIKPEAILADPWPFSGGAAVRPFVQDELFPVLVQVSGPGEMAYLTQLDELGQHLGRSLPPSWPRPSMTIITRLVSDWCRRVGVTPTELKDEETARQRWDAYIATDAVRGPFAAASAAVDRAYETLAAELSSHRVDISDVVGENLERVHKQIEYLEKKALQRYRQLHQSDAGQYLLAWRLLGGDAPQERAYGAISFIDADRRLIDLLLAVPPDGFHRYLYEEERT